MNKCFSNTVQLMHSCNTVPSPTRIVCFFLAFWNLLSELVSFFSPSILEANLHPQRIVCLLAIALGTFREEWGGPSR